MIPKDAKDETKGEAKDGKESIPAIRRMRRMILKTIAKTGKRDYNISRKGHISDTIRNSSFVLRKSPETPGKHERRMNPSTLRERGGVFLWAIDPGDPHCGVAKFMGEKCVAAEELVPWELLGALERQLARGQLDEVVCEEWRLYPQGASVMIGSPMPTVEVIGVIRWLCKRAEVPLTMQPASIKRPTERILRTHGVKMMSRGAGPHARDAEIHGWYHCLRR